MAYFRGLGHYPTWGPLDPPMQGDLAVLTCQSKKELSNNGAAIIECVSAAPQVVEQYNMDSIHDYDPLLDNYKGRAYVIPDNDEEHFLKVFKTLYECAANKEPMFFWLNFSDKVNAYKQAKVYRCEGRITKVCIKRASNDYTGIYIEYTVFDEGVSEKIDVSYDMRNVLRKTFRYDAGNEPSMYYKEKSLEQSIDILSK